jgi:hypothetical protein
MTDFLIGPEPDPNAAALMAGQEFVASVNRLMCDELDLDQLETLSRLLSDIATTYDPNLVRAKAAHYDGLFRGVLAYRKRMQDGALTPPPVPTMWSHPHEGVPIALCARCGYPKLNSPSHDRWAKGEYGVGPDGV